MDNKTVLAGVLMDEHTTISFVEVCQKCNIPEETLIEMMEQGLFNHNVNYVKKIHFNETTLARVQSARRLQEDLDINMPGVVLVLELLDELEQIRNELGILQRHVRGEG